MSVITPTMMGARGTGSLATGKRRSKITEVDIGHDRIRVYPLALADGLSSCRARVDLEPGPLQHVHDERPRECLVLDDHNPPHQGGIHGSLVRDHRASVWPVHQAASRCSAITHLGED